MLIFIPLWGLPVIYIFLLFIINLYKLVAKRGIFSEHQDVSVIILLLPTHNNKKHHC